MITPKSILVATDFSESGADAGEEPAALRNHS